MREKGFTLIEILIAVLILGIVLTTVYASYTGTFRIIGETKSDAELYGMARVALERMTRDMESVSPWKGSFSFSAKTYALKDRDFTGLIFRSAAHVAFGKKEPPAGIAVIEYFIEEKEDEEAEKEGFSLYRSDSLSRDLRKDEPLPPGFLLCDRVENFTCRFYDDKGKEYDSWDSEGGDEKQKNKAPAIVEIRLFLVNEKDREHPYPFMTKVNLPFRQAAAR